MEKSKSKAKQYLIIAISLLLSMVATFGLTIAFFGGSDSETANITLGASIYLAEEDGLTVTTSASKYVVPGQTFTVDAGLNVKKGVGTVTNAVVKIMPTMLAGSTGAGLDLENGTTYDVTINGTKSNDAVVVVYNNELYLAQKSDTTKLYEITPTESGLKLGFSMPIKFPASTTNEGSGQSCSLEFTAVVFQSKIYLSYDELLPLTIENFIPYFGDIIVQTMPTEGLAYTLNAAGDGAVVTGVGSFTGGRMVVPATTVIDGVTYPVTEIAASAFINNTTITNVNLPRSVTTVGERAFQATTLLNNVEMPEVNNLGKCAFQRSTLQNAYVPKVTEFGVGIFNQARSLKTAYIKNAVSIGQQSFMDTIIESAEMPYVKSIGKYGFSRCQSLEYVNAPELLEVGYGSFMGNLEYPMHIVEFNAPKLSKFTDIAAFQCNFDLEILNIDWENITSVPDNTFAYCESLKLEELNLLNVTSIGSIGFWHCETLKKINMPKIQYIGSAAFENCSNLTVDLPEGLLWIADFAFNHCYASTQTSITIPSTVVQIGGTEYLGTNNSDNGVLGTHVFYDCATATLTEYKVASGSANFVAHEGVLYTKGYKYMVAYPSAKTSTSYVMPEGCENFYECSFSRAFNLNDLTLSDTITITNNKPDNFINSERSNLGYGLYQYTNIENLHVKNTNTKYKEIDGVLYTADGKELVAVANKKCDKGTLYIDENCENITLFAFASGVSGSYADLTNGVQAGGRPNKVVFGANITTITDEVIAHMNEYVDNGMQIEVDSANTAFKVEGGYLVRK